MSESSNFFINAALASAVLLDSRIVRMIWLIDLMAMRSPSRICARRRARSQIKLRPTADDDAPVIDKIHHQLLKVKDARCPANQRQINNAKSRFELRMFVKII